MLRVREPLEADVTIATVAAGLAATAFAVAGVILSAICAMKTPRPPITAAVITMLRMTPLCLRKPCRISSRPLQGRDYAGSAEAAIFAKRMSEALTWRITCRAA